MENIKFKDRDMLAEDLLKMLEQGSLHDVRIKLSDGEIVANKDILMARSEYFATMFSNNKFIEGETNSVDMSHCSKAVMERIVKYLFSGEITFDQMALDQLLELYYTTDMMLLAKFKDSLEKYVEYYIRVNNPFPISCVCENSTLDTLMITCSGCRKSHHGACYRILSADDAPAKHICVKCAEDNKPCTDDKLLKMIAKSPELTAATCLYRRILVKLGMIDASNISVDRVLGSMQLHDEDTNRYMQKLVKDGVLEANNQDHDSFDICKSQLQAGMKRFVGVKTQEKAVNPIVAGASDDDDASRFFLELISGLKLASQYNLTFIKEHIIVELNYGLKVIPNNVTASDAFKTLPIDLMKDIFFFSFFNVFCINSASKERFKAFKVWLSATEVSEDQKTEIVESFNFDDFSSKDLLASVRDSAKKIDERLLELFKNKDQEKELKIKELEESKRANIHTS